MRPWASGCLLVCLLALSSLGEAPPEYVMLVRDRLLTQAELDSWYTATRKRVCMHAGEAVLGRQMHQLWIIGKVQQVVANDDVLIVDRDYDTVSVQLKSVEGLREGDLVEAWCMPRSEMYHYVTATGDTKQVRSYLNISAHMDPDAFLANCWRKFIRDLLPPPRRTAPAEAPLARSPVVSEDDVTLLQPVKPRCLRPYATRAP